MVFFICIQFLRILYKQTVETLIRRRVLWSLISLPMSHKKNARRIWVNIIYKYTKVRSASVGKVIDSGSKGCEFVTHQ